MSETNLTPTAFAPLTESERRAADKHSQPLSKEELWEPICPAPEEPEMPSGAAVIWVYRDAESRPLTARVRFERDKGKDVLPYTYGRRIWTDRYGKKRDVTGWHFKQGNKPLGLYGLEKLAAAGDDAPVLLLEGEKTAEAARRLFPDYICMTSQGGSKAAASNDWSPLSGRDVVIWPDHDEAGTHWADSVQDELKAINVACIRLVSVPAGFPRGWDVADDTPPELTDGGSKQDLAILRPLLDNAPLATKNVTLPSGFIMKRDGLYFEEEVKARKGDAEDNTPHFRSVWVCNSFEVIAETNDSEGFGWGLLIRWYDRDRRLHQWAIPKRLVHGEGRDIAAELEDMGLNCNPAAVRYLKLFIAAVATKTRLQCVDHSGWHSTTAGNAFILPGGEAFGPGARAITYQSAQATGMREYRPARSLEDWQDNIAAYASGNSRLTLFMSVAFSGPLLDIAGYDSGGFHLVGGSQVGKSTAAYTAGSVWGRGEKGTQVRSWRATANGLEGVAAATSDTILILDEMGQGNARDVGDTVYMLANGVGKSRASRNGDARAPRNWRSLFLSTGEVTLEDKLREINQRPMAGQQVRLINVPADAGNGHGLYEKLHDKEDGAALSRHLAAACKLYYGTAARAFLKRLVDERSENPEQLNDVINATRKRFESEHVPAQADGQVRSVASRFALAAAGGELACAYGVVPWERGNALWAAGVCFRAWLAERGSTGAGEDSQAVKQVRAFLEAHGSSRFECLERDSQTDTLTPVQENQRIINRVGFRRRVSTNGETVWHYLILPEMWKDEVCKGLNPTRAAQALRNAGFLIPGDGKNLTCRESLPDIGRARVYVIAGSIIGGEEI